jgi:hypothetical protein
MKAAIIGTSIWLCMAAALHAQQAVSGVVTDATTGQPVDAATVRLLRGRDERLTTYTLTDAQGRFDLRPRLTDSLQIAVSLLGYKTVQQAVRTGETLRIALEQQAIALREVEVRPGRVWGMRDTVNYDVTQFLTPRDETFKDVVKKLPGIDVNDAGVISYNGKNISNFYVEGLDLADGKYNLITDNLPAKAVETVQVLENHQPVRALQDKIKTENVALNLKLRPEFRDRWMAYVQGGAGASPLLWKSSGNAMQLSRSSQSTYTVKGNNTGEDVTGEQVMLFERETGKMREPAVANFLAQPAITAPLKKERLLFNDVLSLSVNRISKSGETMHLRLAADYTHDVRRQDRGSRTDYFQPADTLRITEQSHTAIRSDEANVSLQLENNAARHFLTNRLSASGSWNRSASLFTGNHPANQQIATTNLGVKNEFGDIRNADTYTLEIRSLLRYNHLPARLTVGDTDCSLPVNSLYSDQSLAFIRKKGAVSHQYTAGTTGQVNNIRNSYSIYALPAWQWNPARWSVNANVSLPLVWTIFPGTGFSRAAANPSASLRYKFNYAWRISASGSFRETYGNLTDLYGAPYRTDYRHITDNQGIMPVQRQQTYSVYGEYKNTTREFFASMSLNRTYTYANRIYDQSFEGDQMTLTAVEAPNRSSGLTLGGALSKGFYDWEMKASLNYAFNRSRGEQLNNGMRVPYISDYMQYEPKISWTPSRYTEIAYLSTFRYGGSVIGRDTRLTPLRRIVQNLNFSYLLSDVDWNVSAQHYHNDIGQSQSVDAFFADFSVRWKPGRWQFGASVTNLFNKRQYSYTEYTSVQSYTSWIDIRGRELILSARYAF